MKRLFTISLVVFSLIIASTVQAGGLGQKLYFVGLWEGIDESDGSEAQRSITLNSNGTFKIIGQESKIDGCPGRGMLTGTGVLEDGSIIVDDFSIFCDGQSVPLVEEVEATYKPNKRNGILIEVFPGPYPPMILHKISKR